MPTDNKKDYLKRFMQDEGMSSAVHGFFRRVFLKSPANKDVQSLAAAWMAKDVFEAAWRELLNYKATEREEKPTGNIGV